MHCTPIRMSGSLRLETTIGKAYFVIGEFFYIFVLNSNEKDMSRKQLIEILEKKTLVDKERTPIKTSGLFSFFISIIISAGVGYLLYKNNCPVMATIFISIVAFCFIVYFVVLLYDLYWKKYNDIILNANKEIKEKLKDSSLTKDSIAEFRLAQKQFVENHIGLDYLTQEDVDIYSMNYCWGCGNKYELPPMIYKYDCEKRKSKKIYPFLRKVTISQRTYKVLLCQDCYDLMTSNSRKYRQKCRDIGKMPVIMKWQRR